jgi:hypothetical protein
MFIELSRHKLAYSILLMLLFVHVCFFLAVWPDKTSLRIAALSFGLTYFCWGIFAHVKSQHLNRRIVREYFFVSLLAGGMLFFLTW